MAGPGTHLKSLLAQLGVRPSSECECNRRAEQMDGWGVAGCRRESERDEILGWLRKEAAKRSWTEKLTAAANAVMTGLAFRLDPMDPAPGLLDEAIRRAEEDAKS
jgi:hypothetical protein